MRVQIEEKDKTPEELIILFKTLAKRGYFSTGGGAVVVNPNNQNEKVNEIIQLNHREYRYPYH